MAEEKREPTFFTGGRYSRLGGKFSKPERIGDDAWDIGEGIPELIHEYVPFEMERAVKGKVTNISLNGMEDIFSECLLTDNFGLLRNILEENFFYGYNVLLGFLAAADYETYKCPRVLIYMYGFEIAKQCSPYGMNFYGYTRTISDRYVEPRHISNLTKNDVLITYRYNPFHKFMDFETHHLNSDEWELVYHPYNLKQYRDQIPGDLEDGEVIQRLELFRAYTKAMIDFCTDEYHEEDEIEPKNQFKKLFKKEAGENHTDKFFTHLVKIFSNEFNRYFDIVFSVSGGAFVEPGATNNTFLGLLIENTPVSIFLSILKDIRDLRGETFLWNHVAELCFLHKGDVFELALQVVEKFGEPPLSVVRQFLTFPHISLSGFMSLTKHIMRRKIGQKGILINLRADEDYPVYRQLNVEVVGFLIYHNIFRYDDPEAIKYEYVWYFRAKYKKYINVEDLDFIFQHNFMSPIFILYQRYRNTDDKYWLTLMDKMDKYQYNVDFFENFFADPNYTLKLMDKSKIFDLLLEYGSHAQEEFRETIRGFKAKFESDDL